MIKTAVFMIFVVAPMAAAQNAGEIAVLACKNAVARKVRAERPGADSVRVSDARVAATSGRATTVEGSGQFFDRTAGEWRSFTFDCSYSASSGSVRTNVQLAPSSRALGGRR